MVAMRWSPPKPRGCAVVVHGYLDHCGLYGHLIRHLLAQNMAVICCDLPGHGLSSGQPAHIETFNHYLHALQSVVEYANNHFHLPLHAVGQSTGGAIVLKQLIEETGNTATFTSINLLAPLHHPRLWRWLRISYHLTKRFRRGLKRTFVSNSSSTTFVDFIRDRDPLQATFLPISWIEAMHQWALQMERSEGSEQAVTIIQGDADKTLDWRYNLRIFSKKLPAAKIIMIAGGQHHLVNESQCLRKKVFDAMRFSL